uniref:Uncharacterized protein n=1 Tax=Oryza sativa subsp. japonica TaxID=39947 RepID=Q69XW3_ORYSJ|nr:hypothetical protein [Oryza sativa Japonica Group]
MVQIVKCPGSSPGAAPPRPTAAGERLRRNSQAGGSGSAALPDMDTWNGSSGSPAGRRRGERPHRSSAYAGSNVLCGVARPW